MSADSALVVPAQRRPPTSALDPTRFVGRAATDPVAALAESMADACVSAVDVDEVAAILEASGINDRVALREYGAPSVFALATRVVARAYVDAHTVVDKPAFVRGLGSGAVVVDTLFRAAIYLTPLGIGLCASSEVEGVPRLATAGTLLLGWGGGQALAYLGYRTLAERGPHAAARMLGVGFGALAAVWSLVLIGAGPRAYAVALAQLALFAVAAAALVTSRERVVLAWTVPCWLAAFCLAAGLGRPAALGLLGGLVILVAVAYRPAWSAVARARRGRWLGHGDDLWQALRHGAVGAGQAALLMTVALDGVAPDRLPPEAIPLLVGVPLVELVLVWHQRRVAAVRAVLDDRMVFDHRLARLSAGTVSVLGIPVLIGAAIAAAGWVGARPPGGQALAAAILLTSVFAVCLVLAAHRRAGIAAALVWWPTLLVGGVGHWASTLVHVVPQFPQTLATATLLGASLPGLAVAALVLRDPESYR